MGSQAITIELLTDKTLDGYIRALPSKLAEQFTSKSSVSATSSKAEEVGSSGTSLAENLMKTVNSALKIVPECSIPKSECEKIFEIILQSYDSELSEVSGRSGSLVYLVNRKAQSIAQPFPLHIPIRRAKFRTY